MCTIAVHEFAWPRPSVYDRPISSLAGNCWCSAKHHIYSKDFRHVGRRLACEQEYGCRPDVVVFVATYTQLGANEDTCAAPEGLKVVATFPVNRP